MRGVVSCEESLTKSLLQGVSLREESLVARSLLSQESLVAKSLSREDSLTRNLYKCDVCMVILLRVTYSRTSITLVLLRPIPTLGSRRNRTRLLRFFFWIFSSLYQYSVCVFGRPRRPASIENRSACGIAITQPSARAPSAHRGQRCLRLVWANSVGGMNYCSFRHHDIFVRFTSKVRT